MIPPNTAIDSSLARHGFVANVIDGRLFSSGRHAWCVGMPATDRLGSCLWVSCSKNADDWEVSLFDYSGRGMTLNDALTDFRIRLVEERIMINEILGDNRNC